MSGRISFIGAGPGAADLITVRGARRIAEADVVVWAASLVAPECIQEHARGDAELIDSSRLTHEQAIEVYRRAERDKLKVARVHSGDPSLWGAVQEQYDVCARMAVEVEIVPGVPAFSAAAASVGRELTVPEIAQSVVLTRLEGGKTPMPEGERVREFARHGTTMALFLSAARTGQLVEELRAGGYPDDVPVLIAYKVSWPDEMLLRTTLGELERTVKQRKLWRHTLFIVGRALSEGGTRSRLYHAGHFHTYRRADPAARKALRAEREGRSVQDPQAAATELPPETVPEPRAATRRPGQPDPDLAWWAVRDWQQSARETPKATAARPAPNARGRHGSAQPELFVNADTAGEAVGQDGAEAVDVQVDSAPAVVTVPADSSNPDSSNPDSSNPDSSNPDSSNPDSSDTSTTPGSGGTEETAAAEAGESVETADEAGAAPAAQPEQKATQSKGRASAKAGAKDAGGRTAGGKAATGSKTRGKRKTGAGKQDDQTRRE